MFLFPLFLLAGAADAHEEINPLYRELRREGVSVGEGLSAPLPPPTMPDGLSAAEQQRVLRELVRGRYPVAEFTRNSVVAPHLLEIRDVKPSAPGAPARGVDVWFVAHGDLDAVASKDFLDRLSREREDNARWHALTEAELAKRGITIPPRRKDNEGFAFAEFPFLDRVQLAATAHSVWGRTDESVVAAVRVDPRFRGDPEFPNQWRPLKRGRSGKLEPGEAHPYEGAGYYVKVTRLHEPKGALFVESHVIFTEPHGWFGGANLLRSKLPPVVQSEVRSFRRQVAKASR
ncbi:MAG TPA: hypothetical protein VIL46_03085 [Gemmataceae bacterium]